MRPLRLAGTAAPVAVAAVLGLAACGGGGGGGEAAGTTETAATQTGTASATGDAASGKAVFASQGCASCHTLKAAGATGSVGPNLDEQLQSDAQKAGEALPQFTHDSIVDPNAFVAGGFSAGVMPGNFGDQLSDKQLNDLVAFVVQSVGG